MINNIYNILSTILVVCLSTMAGAFGSVVLLENKNFTYYTFDKYATFISRYIKNIIIINLLIHFFIISMFLFISTLFYLVFFTELFF